MNIIGNQPNKRKLQRKWMCERIVPGAGEETNPCFQWLFFHYKFAKQFVEGKVVLDAGCGEGYGANYLTEVSDKVIGIDISEEAIEVAEVSYKKENLQFFVRDVCNTLLLDQYFDVVCSFEVIEHLPISKHTTYLLEMYRLLKTNGIFLLSTPNREMRLKPGQKPFNPSHIYEFSANELKTLLKNYFSVVELLGIYGNEKYRLWQSCEKKSVRHTEFLLNIVQKFDPLKIRKRTISEQNRSLLIALAKRFERAFAPHLKNARKSIGTEDFYTSKENVDKSEGLIAICKK